MLCQLDIIYYSFLTTSWLDISLISFNRVELTVYPLKPHFHWRQFKYDTLHLFYDAVSIAEPEGVDLLRTWGCDIMDQVEFPWPWLHPQKCTVLSSIGRLENIFIAGVNKMLCVCFVFVCRALHMCREGVVQSAVHTGSGCSVYQIQPRGETRLEQRCSCQKGKTNVKAILGYSPLKHGTKDFNYKIV